MKNNPKTVGTKKRVLDNSLLEEEFFEDVALIAIVCARPSYQFIWQINQAFNYEFERKHDYEIEMNNLFYEVYSYLEKDKLIEHVIFTNRKQRQFLIEEAKNIDFIWMIKGGYLSKTLTNELAAMLSKINMIDTCFVLNPSQLKSKQLLIL